MSKDSSPPQVLVYHHRHNGSPVVDKGLAVVTETKLDYTLLKHPELQLTRKAIPRGVFSIDIHQQDLMTESQKAEAGNNLMDANIVGIDLPVRVVISRFTGAYKELIILSKKL